MATKRLGKGLEALIRPYEEMQAPAPAGVTEIALSKIKANPNQPRKDGLDNTSLEELVASIKEKGVIIDEIKQQNDQPDEKLDARDEHRRRVGHQDRRSRRRSLGEPDRYRRRDSAGTDQEDF